MSQQTIFSQLKDNISQPKSFRVDLPDEYAFPASYPGAKDYPTPPDNAVIDALMKYSESTHEAIEFISTDTPIRFSLITKNGPEIYQANIVKGAHHPRNLGYYISCVQI